MTFAPATIRDLAAYWVKNGGVNLGIVGDRAHQKRATYHNGQDVIERYGRTALNDYSIRLRRDREPYLTNAASALDLGHTDKTVLRKFSNWLVAACLRDPAVRRDIREIIYSPNGSVVQRYSGEDNVVRSGGGDDSHLWHTHISFYRDSEFRNKVALFAPFFDSTVELPDTSTEGPEPMGPRVIPASKPIGRATVKAATSIIASHDGEYFPIEAGKVRDVYAIEKFTEGKYAGEECYLVLIPTGEDQSGYIRAATCDFAPAATVDLLAVKRAEYDRVKAGATVALPPRP